MREVYCVGYTLRAWDPRSLVHAEWSLVFWSFFDNTLALGKYCFKLNIEYVQGMCEQE